MKCTFALCTAILILPASAAEMPSRPDRGEWPPVIGAWFWTERDLEPEGCKSFLDAAAERSPYTLLSTTCRRVEVVDPQAHQQTDKAVRYAATRGLKVALELDLRLARQAFRAKYPDEQQEELTLRFLDFADNKPAEAVFQGVDTADHMNGSLPRYECLATRLVRVYSFVRDRDGIDPTTVRDITAESVATAEGPRKLTVRVPEQPGRSACVIASHTYLTPDVFAPHLIEFQRAIIQQYADLPLAGIMKDEWGFPPDPTGNPKHDRYWYSAAMARAYAEGSGRDLVRDTLLMCAGEKGRERERQAAINRYGAMGRRRNAAIEDDYYRTGKEVFGKAAFIVTHPTWWPYPGAQEFRKNGLSWWDATRDFGQTDEQTPYPCRTSLAKRWDYPLWYNQYYSREAQPYLREFWAGVLSGGRLNVHPLYPRPDLKLGERETLLLESGLMAAMTRLRMLDFITRAPLDCPVAVTFGHANAMNWAGTSYDRVGLEIASSLCAAGYPADFFPSSLVGSSALRLDDKGYVCLGPQRYRALVLYRPEFCGQAELQFFTRAATGKTAIFQVGEWTCDSEARPLKTTQVPGEKVRLCADDDSCATKVKSWLEGASVPRVTGWDRKDPTRPLPPVDGLACLTDGTCIRAAGSRNAAGDPILETFTWQGHAVEVDALGLVAIRFAPDGRVTGFAAGGLKRVKTDGLDLELPGRADLAFLRNADRTCAGVLQGLAGDVPAPLQAITRHWQRLAVPRSALSPTSPH
ncbi:MAG TPA: hypothetical protein P5205_03440 [Candidatus Paceibacterota bacterium]|nr:hypothetical protein [Verrucomicrobiota bacterium]HSA09404.1 hypothetical protein [Candidatus Paceibacterota bacterium]